MIGEGAGIVVLERLADAESRGAIPLAELAGYGTNGDMGDLRRPNAGRASQAMQMALSDAGIAPQSIGYVNAHGTGTVPNDVEECRAMESTFGAHLPDLPTSSTKPVHGHTIGAAGAIELITTVQALRTIPAPDAQLGNRISAVPRRPGCQYRTRPRIQCGHEQFIRIRRHQCEPRRPRALGV